MSTVDTSEPRLKEALETAVYYRRKPASKRSGYEEHIVVLADAVETLRLEAWTTRPLDHVKCAEELARLTSELAAKQARIDALMFEHCPEEMTEAQKAEWARHQVPVSAQTLLSETPTAVSIRKLAEFVQRLSGFAPPRQAAEATEYLKHHNLYSAAI